MTSLKTDVLVIGAGLAGTLFSLELAKKRSDLNILILSKKDKRHSSSYLAQGGIAAVLPDTDDSMEQHVADTLSAGGHANDPSVVDHFVSKSPDAIRTLESWNICFDRDIKGTKALALEGGHSLPRVLHHKDFTGKHIMQQLHSRLEEYSNITLMEDVELFGLIQPDQSGGITGVYAWNHEVQQVLTVQAVAVVLSTGGVGALFRYTTNPPTATGHGIALAEKAGAGIQDIVNIQFHPTALWQQSGSHLPLISEALRGAGAVLRNETGEPFMVDKHPLQDLAPRDVVARNIIKELGGQKNPFVFLDGTSIKENEWQNHFPGIFKICENAGINPRKEWIPVVPAAHYSCGGVKADVKGSTNVHGLYVLGETACTGLHGANRLASNSLLEATIMAMSLAEDFAAGGIENKSSSRLPAAPELTVDDLHVIKAENYLNEVREIMQQHCSVVKTTSGLKTAAQKLSRLAEGMGKNLPLQSFYRVSLELSLYTAKMIVEKSLEAKGNRGVFYNEDLVGVCQE